MIEKSRYGESVPALRLRKDLEFQILALTVEKVANAAVEVEVNRGAGGKADAGQV